MLRIEKGAMKNTRENSVREYSIEDVLHSTKILDELSATGLVAKPVLDELLDCLRYLRGSLLNDSNRPTPVFTWQKSLLVSAIERGDWVLIEDADQCPPAILDRLNPILERSYSKGKSAVVYEPVLLPEAPPASDGSPAYISPHPLFRLFLLVDEFNGSKLSRAVIDRSVSVRISEDHSVTSNDSASFTSE
eukprot:IDg16356t1